LNVLFISTFNEFKHLSYPQKQSETLINSAQMSTTQCEHPSVQLVRLAAKELEVFPRTLRENPQPDGPGFHGVIPPGIPSVAGDLETVHRCPKNFPM